MEEKVKAFLELATQKKASDIFNIQLPGIHSIL